MRHAQIFLKFVAFALVSLIVAGHSIAATPDYPLKLGVNSRYLVDQNGRPILIQGESPWSILVQLTKEEAEQYLTNRHRKGFNSIIVNLIEHEFCDNPPLNRYGDAPFTTPGDYATPNPAYFAHVDWFLKRAAAYGIQVFLVPSYLGYDGGSQGWYGEMTANGAAKLRDYGRFLGQRYKNFDNIVWLNGGDYNPPDKALVNAIAEGILEFDSNHIHTAHCAPETSAREYYPTETWLHLNNTYTYFDVLNKSRADYAGSPARAFFLIESNYEGIAPDHPERNPTAQEIRRQAYWSIFSGSCGQFMGNYPLWGFYDGWQAAMNAAASQSMANLRRLMDSRPWWTFVPDTNNSIVVAGFGDLNATDPDQYYVTAARINDGSSLWAYLPTGRTITVDLGKISGANVQAWWFSPRTGNAATAGQFGNTGLQSFTTPAGEGASQDWVLVLDDVAQNFAPPGITTIQNWRTTYFSAAELSNPLISGDTADPDGDGRNNLMEYALFSDPTVPDINLTPVQVSLVGAGPDRVLSLSYTRRKNGTDVSFATKAGTSLQVWNIASGPTSLTNNSLTETVTAQDNMSVSMGAPRFMRLEVTP